MSHLHITWASDRISPLWFQNEVWPPPPLLSSFFKQGGHTPFWNHSWRLTTLYFWTTLFQKGGHTLFWIHSVRWTTLFIEPPCCRRGGGVTPHSEFIEGDEPPCIFWTTLLQKGGHTPFWNHSERWISYFLFLLDSPPQVIEQSLFLFSLKWSKIVIFCQKISSSFRNHALNVMFLLLEIFYILFKCCHRDFLELWAGLYRKCQVALNCTGITVYVTVYELHYPW